jgi:hypothetical protein
MEVEIEMSMEDIIMGSKNGKKGKKGNDKSYEKREEMRTLKRLAHIDPYKNEESCDHIEAGKTFMNLLKFIKDPMVKAKFEAADYKTINNNLVDIVKVFKKLKNAKSGDMLEKI